MKLGYNEHLVITNRFLNQMGHFSTYINLVITNPSYNEQKRLQAISYDRVWRYFLKAEYNIKRERLYYQLRASKNESLLVCDWDQPEQPGCLHWTPFAAGAIRKWNHDGLRMTKHFYRTQLDRRHCAIQLCIINKLINNLFLIPNDVQYNFDTNCKIIQRQNNFGTSS